MGGEEYIDFKLRFTFAGRLLLLLIVMAAVGFGWLAFLSIAEAGVSFPVFVPFAIGAGGAVLLFGLMRVVYHVCGIQFWSALELERRAKGKSDSPLAGEVEPLSGDEMAESGDADQGIGRNE